MTSNLQQTHSAIRRRVAEAFGAGFFLIYAVILLLHRAPPSLTDYANWVYQGVLLHGHLLGAVDTAHRLKVYPVPNSAATFGIGLLCFLVPWKWAADVWLCLQLMVSWWSIRQMLRVSAGSPWLWAIVPVTTFLNVNFWYGFVNFQLGLCWVILLGAMLLHAAKQGRLERPWHAGFLLVICFFTHMIPFSFCCVLLLLYAVQTRSWRVLWQALPAGLLTLWYAAGRFLLEHNADGQAGMVETFRTYSGMFWLYKANSYFKSFGFVDPLGLDRILFGRSGALLLLAANLALCVLLGWSMIRNAKRVQAGQHPERFLWLAILAVLPLYLLLPGEALGVSDPGSRLLQTALALAIVLCGQAPEKTLRAAAPCALLLGAAGIILFARCGFAYKQFSPSAKAVRSVEGLNRIPENDQDFYYQALGDGKTDLPVFPTGMFLNR